VINKGRNDTTTKTIKYDKKGFLKSISWTDSDYYTDEDGPGTFVKGVNKYTTKRKGNRATKITCYDRVGGYITVSKYNARGFLKSVVEEVVNDGIGFENHYKYKMKGRYIKERIEGDPRYTGACKKQFFYGKAKSTKTKYYKTINLDERVVLAHLNIDQGE
jgi:hypothetical protein